MECEVLGVSAAVKVNCNATAYKGILDNHVFKPTVWRKNHMWGDARVKLNRKLQVRLKKNKRNHSKKVKRL